MIPNANAMAMIDAENASTENLLVNSFLALKSFTLVQRRGINTYECLRKAKIAIIHFGLENAGVSITVV